MCFSSSRDREQSRFFALFLFIFFFFFLKTTEKSRRHPAKRTPIFFTLILLLLCVDYTPPLLLLPHSLVPLSRNRNRIHITLTALSIWERKKNRRSKLKDNFCTSLLDFLFLSSAPTKRRAQLFFIAINYFLLVRSRLLTYTHKHVHLHADLCACTLNWTHDEREKPNTINQFINQRFFCAASLFAFRDRNR